MDISNKIAVIGFGYIGSVIGSVLAEKGYSVAGIEKNSRIIEAVNKGTSPFNEPHLEDLIRKNVQEKRLWISSDAEKAKDCNIFVITVGTPLAEDDTADTSQIIAAAESIQPFMKEDSLVILKSTVPPFTTSEIVAPILCKDVNVNIAFCPERLAEGKAVSEFLSIPVVVGGIDEKSTKKAAEFWRHALDVEVIEVGDSVTSEMVKLADNLWIDVNIALAGELAKLAKKLNVDVLDIIRAANSLPKGDSHVNWLTPSVGVGGYCLTKDPWFVQNLGEKYDVNLQLPKTCRKINDGMPEYSAMLIDEILQKKELDRKNLKIAVLGIAFKNNTGDCRFTPTKFTIDKLVGLGYQVSICDPLTEKHDQVLVTTQEVNANIMETIKDADCVAFLAGHDIFHEISIEQIAQAANKNALIFDGRMFFSKEKIKQMEQHHLQFCGVGR